MKSQQKKDYYQTLQITKKASQQEVKQAYKKLALIHHPDKNSGTEQSKIKFTQISQAYTVLNDPKKRENYDKYGVADLQGLNFQQFMQSFQGFQDFLSQVLSFNTFDAMFSGFNTKKTKRNATKSRGRAKGRQKNMSGKEMEQLMKMMGGDIQGNLQMALFQAMMQGGMMDLNDLQQLQKQVEKAILQSDDDQGSQEWNLTQQQIQILQFAKKNVQTKKIGNKKKKKTQTRCKFDNNKIEQDQILMHFSQNHMDQFKKWLEEEKRKNMDKSNTREQNNQKNTPKPKQNENQKKVQQQIQY